MKARSRTLLSTIALVALAVGAVAYAWFGVEKKDQAVQARKDAEAKLYGFAPEKVKAFTLTAKGATSRLEREGEAWKLTAPVAAPAERYAAQAVVDKVAGLRRKAAIAEKPDAAALAGYGLAKPRARVELTVDSGPAQTLELGDENAFDGTVFVRTTSGAVELVPGDLRWTIEKEPFDLRDKRLLTFEDADVAKLEVAGPKRSYALAREAQGWKLLAPVAERADDAAAGRVAGAIRSLRATAFAPEDDAARKALARPAWRVTLTPASGPARTLLLAPPYAKLEEASEVAKVPDDATRDLDQDVFALRDKKVLRFERDAAAALRFEGGGGPAFQVTKDTPGGRLAGLAWTLGSLQASAFADESGKSLAQHGLAPPAREVAVLDKDGKELDRLSLSAEKAGKVYARGARAGRIVQVDAAALATLPRSAADLEEKKPAPGAEAKALDPASAAKK
ncbi:MAG TPA: DUF4340 domain-containing protein [Anaeromyxobacteraceae bacterium]|nr:DUF4340 domain-containing protein [Anaeromyxobacteraceae bacterium]